MVQARYLRPGTLVGSIETMPSWMQIEEEGQRLLLTITAETPGMGEARDPHKIGFNLLLVDGNGNMLSWAPLTMRFSWDSPSVWGLLTREEYRH